MHAFAARGHVRSSSPRRREGDDGGESNPEQGKNADPQDHQLCILTDLGGETNGSPFGVIEQLLEARGALERSEAGRALETLLTAAPERAPAASSRDRGRASHQSAEQEISRSSPYCIPVHGTIVPCASRPSVTFCLT
jgi:hypothetical protein